MLNSGLTLPGRFCRIVGWLSSGRRKAFLCRHCRKARCLLWVRCVSRWLMTDIQHINPSDLIDTAAIAEAVWQSGWRLPDKLTVSEWADANRILDERVSAEPGPWRTSRVPYMREIMDAFSDPRVERITMMFATQLAKTECLQNMNGYAVDQDPGPILWAFPRRDDAKDFSKNRIALMWDDAKWDEAKTGRAHDATVFTVKMKRCIIHFGYAESPPTLSSHPIRYVFKDELDEWRRSTTDGKSPTDMADERTKNFWNRKIVEAGNPTTQFGNIYLAFAGGDRRHYMVPCPHCGKFQQFVMPQVKWDPADKDDPDRIRTARLAWYKCEYCNRRIDDGHKPAMLARGVWVPEDASFDIDSGALLTHKSMTLHATYQLSSIYSPWVSFSEVAAGFIKATATSEITLRNFINNWLGEIWQEDTEEVHPGWFESLKMDYPRGVVPEPVWAVVAGVDVQKGHLYYVIRGFGADLESWLIQEGTVESFGELEDVTFRRTFTRTDGVQLRLAVQALDMQYRTAEVYDYCRAWPDAFPVRGAEGYNVNVPWKRFSVDRYPNSSKPIPGGLTYYQVWSHYWKDRLQKNISTPPGAPGRFNIHRDITDDYVAQMTAEKKISPVNPKTGVAEPEWINPRHRPNHFWDCETYALAAAEELVRIRTLTADPHKPQPQPQQKRKRGGNWMDRTENWLTR